MTSSHRSLQPAGIGHVPATWTVAQLAAFCARITYGFTNPMPEASDGPLLLTAKDIQKGQINYNTARHTSWDAYRTLLTDKSRPQIGDILLTKDGSIGRVALTDRDDLCINQSVALLRPNERILPQFLKYLLETPYYQERMEADADGSTIKHIYITRVDKMEVAVPPKAEQSAITNLLGCLDAKIFRNFHMNETIEGMSRAIFKDWFVDFGPTRAKMEGVASYLAPEFWGLFPQDLDDEEIPEGWASGTLADVAALNPETWTRATYPSCIEYVDLANTKWGVIESTEQHTKESAPSRAQRVLRQGDTIVGTVRPGNGSYAYVGGEGLTGSTGFAVLRPKHRRYTEVCYLAATAPTNIERLSHLADGAAYPAVRPDIVSATALCCFPEAAAEAFSSVVRPLFDRMELNKKESSTLAQTRDLLLPKLMSGEIRLREAEKVVAEVA